MILKSRGSLQETSGKGSQSHQEAQVRMEPKFKRTIAVLPKPRINNSWEEMNQLPLLNPLKSF